MTITPNYVTSKHATLADYCSEPLSSWPIFLLKDLLLAFRRLKNDQTFKQLFAGNLNNNMFKQFPSFWSTTNIMQLHLKKFFFMCSSNYITIIIVISSSCCTKSVLQFPCSSDNSEKYILHCHRLKKNFNVIFESIDNNISSIIKNENFFYEDIHNCWGILKTQDM